MEPGSSLDDPSDATGFICWCGIHVDGWDPDNDDKRRIVSIARTREHAQALAIQRILGLCILDGYITTVKQRRLTEDEFMKIEATLAEVCKKHGLP